MIDRQFLRDFANEAETVLEKLAKKHGVKLQATYASGSYDRGGDNAALKFNLSVVTKSGKVLTKAARDFEAMAYRYGLTANDFGSLFVSNDETFEITGLVTRRRKFPISAKRVRDGKPFKFPAEKVKRALGR